MNQRMTVLTPDDHDFFKHNGYVVVKDTVPQKNLSAMVDAIFWFLEMDPSNPNDWYRPPHRTGGMVEISQHQAIWDNRQAPRIYAAFAEILGNHKLWVSMDRACFKPPQHPNHPDYDFKGFIHWDANTSNLVLGEWGVQGVLALTDTGTDQGGFQCVPELYRNLEEWIETQPPDRNPEVPDLTGFTVTSVPVQAGDLIIWHKYLPHGSGHNISDVPRFAQYITMSPPAEETDVEKYQERIRMWRNRLRFPNDQRKSADTRRFEERFGVTAKLTPLGRKLLGLDHWDD